MNNPISLRPGHELYPSPEGCTGHRLWQMLHARTGASRQSYMEVFERRNLVRGVEYDSKMARLRAGAIVAEVVDSGRTVVLLGHAVREAFNRALGGRLPPLIVHPVEIGGCTWRQVPHPSGRNLWYNNAENRKVVEMLMEELYNDYAGKVAKTTTPE